MKLNKYKLKKYKIYHLCYNFYLIINLIYITFINGNYNTKAKIKVSPVTDHISYKWIFRV